jgi:hypothetical protein
MPKGKPVLMIIEEATKVTGPLRILRHREIACPYPNRHPWRPPVGQRDDIPEDPRSPLRWQGEGAFKSFGKSAVLMGSLALNSLQSRGGAYEKWTLKSNSRSGWRSR